MDKNKTILKMAHEITMEYTRKGRSQGNRFDEYLNDYLKNMEKTIYQLKIRIND